MTNPISNLNSEISNPDDGWRWNVFDDVDSTNRVARDAVMELWARGKSAHRLAVRAAQQTGGHGQYGRRWESPAGGLYLSLVFEDVPEDFRARLALVAGMAVIEVLHETCQLAEKLRLRWPNDVLVDGKKVAGILCEALAQGDQWATVVGIGINVNTSLAQLPEPLRATATSLQAVTGREWPLEKLATAVALSLEHWLNMTREFGIPGLVQCISHVDALKNQPLRLQVDSRIIEGTGAGLDPDGSLRIRTADGTIQSFDRGSIV